MRPLAHFMSAALVLLLSSCGHVATPQQAQAYCDKAKAYEEVYIFCIRDAYNTQKQLPEIYPPSGLSFTAVQSCERTLNDFGSATSSCLRYTSHQQEKEKHLSTFESYDLAANEEDKLRLKGLQEAASLTR